LVTHRYPLTSVYYPPLPTASVFTHLFLTRWGGYPHFCGQRISPPL
jgi:hypothetical protein